MGLFFAYNEREHFLSPLRHFDKPYLGHKALLELMKKRGLKINDDKVVYQALQRIGYYRLTGYFLPFQKTNNQLAPHDFKPGIAFDDVLSLYYFDTQLRNLITDALGKLEVAIRTSICEYMCRKSGAHWYTTESAFEVGKYQGIIDLAAKHSDFDLANNKPYKQYEPEKKSRQLFLDHYYDEYNSPKMPAAWMLREIASFGFWARVYDALRVGDRKQVAQSWRHPNGKKIDEELLASWLWSISILRNRCSHHTRITHRNFPFPPKLPEKNPSRELFYSKTDDLRTLITIIYVLINCVEPTYDWKGKLLALFSEYDQVDIEKATGFSKEGKSTWEQTSFWIATAGV